MPTAVKVADEVGGFAGPGTLYRVDPPMNGTEYVLLYHQPPAFGQHGQLCVILATKNGASFTRDVRPQPGTYVTDEPNHALSLQLAGGYVVTEPAPVETPPEEPAPDEPATEDPGASIPTSG